MKKLFYLLFIGLACSYFACQNDDDLIQQVPKDFIADKTGDQAIFLELTSNNFPTPVDFTSADYDHYILSVFQNDFDQQETSILKSINGHTNASPYIDQLFVNDYNIPFQDEKNFHQYFRPDDNTLIPSDPLAVLPIKKQENIPFLLKKGKDQITGFFPPLEGDIKPHLSPNTNTINKNGGTKLIWNADESNKLDVLIIALGTTSPGKRSLEFITANDNGVYQFTASDLEQFLPSTQIQLFFIRGNYGISTDKILIGSIQFLNSQEYMLIE